MTVRSRLLGKTGLSLSELTTGTSGLDEGRCADPSEADAAITFALERGINAIEVASGSDAESLIGSVLRRERAGDHVRILSRVRSLVPFDLPSPHVLAQQAYPGHHIRAETETSLKRLGVERLACQQIHAWCPEWLGEGDWLETLVRLREEGKIAAIGVSLFDHDVDAGIEIVASGAVDCIQVMYNIFDQGAAAALFPLCQKHGVAVIARSPLYYGALSPRIRSAQPFHADDWRSGYFFEEHLSETGERVDALAKEVSLPDRSVTNLALRFSLSHPAVSTVAVGMLTRQHVEDNLRALEHGGLSAEELAGLRRHRWLC